ncbi:hypothetical protein C8Q78DRAFT_935220, partial [Trametes maxima]
YILRNATLRTQKGTYHGHAIVTMLPLSPTDKLHSQVAMIRVEAVTAPKHAPRPLIPQLPPLPVLRIQIGKSRLPFLLDTGAQINCIHTEVFKTIGGSYRMPNPNLKVVSAAGQELVCHGVWRTPVTFGNICTVTDLHIIDNLSAPGILGRPWQHYNQMWLKHTMDGITVGVRSYNGERTYEVLICSPEAQRKAWAEASTLANTIQEEAIPTMNFSETQQLRDLVNPVQVDSIMQENEDGYATTEPASSPEPEDALFAEPFTPEYDPWTTNFESEQELGPTPHNVENRMYRQLMLKYAVDYNQSRSNYQPQVERLEVFESDRYNLRESWKLHISREEELFLLRNVLVKVGGRYREGHAALHMLYFPHTTDRARQAEQSQPNGREGTEPLELSEDENYQRPPRGIGPAFTEADLHDSMEEMEFESTQ